MNKKRALQLYFTIVLLTMLAVTTWASSYENVFSGGGKLLALPWGVATLFDTYFGFLVFYCWVAYKEIDWGRRILWLVAILALGNIAMAAYCLWQLRLQSEGFDIQKFLLRRTERA